MPKAGDLKKGMVVDINDVPHVVKTAIPRNPSSRGASTLIKVRFNNLITKQKLDESYKSDDMLQESDCSRLTLAYSYQDGDEYFFINNDDYAMYSMNADELDDNLDFISEGLDGVIGLIIDDNLVSIEMPQTINLEIVETAPGIKGASASARTKPAKLSTGLEVQVPEYITTGEVIKINTVTRTFMQRA